MATDLTYAMNTSLDDHTSKNGHPRYSEASISSTTSTPGKTRSSHSAKAPVKDKANSGAIHFRHQDHKFHLLRGLSQDLASIPCLEYGQRSKLVRNHMEILKNDLATFLKEAKLQTQDGHGTIAQQCIISLATLHMCKHTPYVRIDQILQNLQDPQTATRRSLAEHVATLKLQVTSQVTGSVHPPSKKTLQEGNSITVSSKHPFKGSRAYWQSRSDASIQSTPFPISSTTGGRASLQTLDRVIKRSEIGTLFTFEGKMYEKLENQKFRLLRDGPKHDGPQSTDSSLHKSSSIGEENISQAQISTTNNTATHHSTSSVTHSSHVTETVVHTEEEPSIPKLEHDVIDTPPSYYASLQHSVYPRPHRGSHRQDVENAAAPFKARQSKAWSFHADLLSAMYEKRGLNHPIGVPPTSYTNIIAGVFRLAMHDTPLSTTEHRVTPLSTNARSTAELPDTATPQTNNSFSADSETPGEAARPSKRRRPNGHFQSNKISMGSEGSDSSPSGVSSGKIRHSPLSDSKGFACPYWTKTPRPSHSCAQYYLKDICAVKQHLYRIHKRPDHHCFRCFEEFTSHTDLEEHSRNNPPCETRPDPYDDKMSCDKHNQIKMKERVRSPEEKWFYIFETLFPRAQRPDSAYKGDLEITNCVHYMTDLLDFLDLDTKQAILIDISKKTAKGLHPSEEKTLKIIRQCLEDFATKMRNEQQTLAAHNDIDCERATHQLAADSRATDCEGHGSLLHLIGEVQALYAAYALEQPHQPSQMPQQHQDQFLNHLSTCSQEAMSNNFAYSNPFMPTSYSLMEGEQHSALDHSFNFTDTNTTDLFQNHPDINFFNDGSSLSPSMTVWQ